jgi:hypothetical protein
MDHGSWCFNIQHEKQRKVMAWFVLAFGLQRHVRPFEAGRAADRLSPSRLASFPYRNKVQTFGGESERRDGWEQAWRARFRS